MVTDINNNANKNSDTKDHNVNEEADSSSGEEDSKEHESHEISHESHKDKINITDNDSQDGKNNEETEMVIIKPLNYQRGERHVFAASKREGAMYSASTKNLDKVKEKVTVGDNKCKNKTKQEHQVIDFDSENEEEERVTSILLQSKDDEIRYL